jgi:hypothetical protein
MDFSIKKSINHNSDNNLLGRISEHFSISSSSLLHRVCCIGFYENDNNSTLYGNIRNKDAKGNGEI